MERRLPCALATVAPMVAAAAACATGQADTRSGASGLSRGPAGGTTDTAGTATVGSGTAGGTASAGASEGTTAGGGCVGPPYRVEVPGGWLADVTVVGGDIVAVGTNDGAGGRLVRLDPCDGTKINEQILQLDGDTGTKLYAARPLGADLVVAGSAPAASDPREGLFARVVPQTLTSVWAQSVTGTPGDDELLTLDVSATGRVFLGGYTDEGTRLPWLASADGGGQACAFGVDLGPDTTGDVGAVAFSEDGSEVFVAVDASAGVFFLRFEAECACPCTPLTSAPLSLPVENVKIVVLGLAASGGQVLATGAYQKQDGSNDLGAFVAAVAPISGAVSAVWTADPTPMGDGWVRSSIGDGRLLVAGGRNWNGLSQTFAGATAAGAAVDLPVTNLTTPAWEVEPTDVEVLTAAVFDPAHDAVVFVGNQGGEGVVVGCTADGVCP